MTGRACLSLAALLAALTAHSAERRTPLKPQIPNVGPLHRLSQPIANPVGADVSIGYAWRAEHDGELLRDPY